MDVFCAKFSSRIGDKYVVHTKDYKWEKSINYIPAYMVPFIQLGSINQQYKGLIYDRKLQDYSTLFATLFATLVATLFATTQAKVNHIKR